MIVAVRVDGSARIGMGHVMRTLAFARRLRAQGADVSFLMRPSDDVAPARVRDAGFPVRLLDADRLDVERHPWLGVAPERDAADTAALLAAGETPDWLVADNYGIDERWERALRPSVRALLAFDDLADRRHDVDALIDQNVVDDAGARYAALVPPHARLFVGPRFAQLRDQFVRRSGRRRARDGTIERVLVAFGSDSGTHTAIALEALERVRAPLQVTAILADRAPRAVDVRQIVERRGWTLLGYVEEMAALLDASDLVVGAGGTSAWERAVLGVPTIAWTIADNQRDVIAALAAAGAIVTVASPDAASVAALVAQLCGDPDRVRAIGDAALGVMAGHAQAIAELDAFLVSHARAGRKGAAGFGR